MDGTASWADNEVTIKLWELRQDASNYIDGYITANDTFKSNTTGIGLIRRANAGSYATLVAATTDYTPGVNVSFSLSARYTGTEMNIAQNGTAATAVSGDALSAALSDEDLGICGSAFTGNIGKLRIFAADIGDDGIEEASA